MEGKQNCCCCICSPSRPVARALRRHKSVLNSNPSLAWGGTSKAAQLLPWRTASSASYRVWRCFICKGDGQLVHSLAYGSERNSPAWGLKICIMQTWITARSRNSLLVNGLVTQIKKVRKENATCASYASDEWPFTQAAGQRDKSNTLTSSATLKMQTHPLPFDIYSLSFKNLLHYKVCSCDSWWVTGASL